MGYKDLQLLKARKGQSLQMSQSSHVDPVKAKKRYIILTYFEKFNVNDVSHESSLIREEIEAGADKTHYPMPLSMVEIKDMRMLKEMRISKALMRQII